MSSKLKPPLWQTGLLALALHAGCGGSASRHDAEPPSSRGGAASDPPWTGGGNATQGGAVTLAGGGNGSSAGGATDGGSSQDFGGMADAGAAPELPLPPGCRPRTPEETADLCSLAVDCEASPSLRTYCHRLDSGRWECQCANHESIYRLENAAGIRACALAAWLCSDDALELGDESCEATSERSDQDSCTTDVTCGSPIDLDATTGARAWLMRFGSARCNRSDATESFDCSCSNGALTSNYGLLTDSGEPTCAPLADFCMSGRAPVFDGEEACLPLYTTSDSEGCGRAEACGAQMPLTDDVSLAQFKERFASCVARPGGGSECSFSGQDSAFLFQLSTPPVDASCEASIPNCDLQAVIETTSPANCEPLSLSTSGSDECRAVLTCVQNATVDDRSIVAHGTLVVVCRRAQMGMPWVCSFASGPKTGGLELGAVGANASQACNQASAALLQSPGLYLGPSGDLMEPPDPAL